MKINPEFYPAIILITFTFFLLLGLLLGFVPRHESGREGARVFPTRLQNSLFFEETSV